MSRPPNTKSISADYIFQTPIKKNPKHRQLLLTNDETYEKSNQKSIQSSHSIQTNPMTMNIFKKKKYTKSIRKSTLKLLAQQGIKLHDMKSKADTYSDSVMDSYKQQLDKVYVVVGRIEKIHEDKKYYTIYCRNDGIKEFKLYFLKHLTSDNATKGSNKSEFQTKRRITDLDSLEFEHKNGEGVPYFKFFVIFREIPIYEKGDNEVLNSEEHLSETESEDYSFRKKYHPKIKGTEFRIYIEHFEKVQDFNYLTYHNMSVAFEYLSQQQMKAKKMEIFHDL